MSNAKALLISLLVASFAVVLLFSYINSREKAILEMATPVKVVVANRDIPEGRRIDTDMVILAEIPQKYVQPGAFNDLDRILDRDITVPVLKGTQILESMFVSSETQGIGAKIPTGKRAFSIFMTEVTAVGELIQPGDMVDLMVTVEVGSFEDGRGVSEEIITKTVLENILVLAVNQTSSKRRASDIGNMNQDMAGSVFQTEGRQGQGRKKDPIKTITVAVSPIEVQKLNLAQEIGSLSAALRSKFDEGRIENLPSLSARDFLGIQKTIMPRSNPAWVEIRGAEPFSRYGN